MLKDTSGFCQNRVVESITIKRIVFPSFEGTTVIIPIGSKLLVDLDEEVANYQSHNFDISDDEHCVVEV